ncbi:MAG TPA: hypothetical protein VGN97_13430 [Mesorhizobium sp.]|jgi:hypothetical protein|nr:hypothetical protein [Mesorhizobium sp.]
MPTRRRMLAVLPAIGAAVTIPSCPRTAPTPAFAAEAERVTPALAELLHEHHVNLAALQAKSQNVASLKANGLYPEPAWKIPPRGPFEIDFAWDELNTVGQAETVFARSLAKLDASERQQLALPWEPNTAAALRRGFASSRARIETWRAEAVQSLTEQWEARRPLIEAQDRWNEAAEASYSSLERLLPFPCLTLADVRAKAEAALRTLDVMRDDGCFDEPEITTLLRSIAGHAPTSETS